MLSFKQSENNSTVWRTEIYWPRQQYHRIHTHISRCIACTEHKSRCIQWTQIRILISNRCECDWGETVSWGRNEEKIYSRFCSVAAVHSQQRQCITRTPHQLETTTNFWTLWHAPLRQCFEITIIDKIRAFVRGEYVLNAHKTELQTNNAKHNYNNFYTKDDSLIDGERQRFSFGPRPTLFFVFSSLSSSLSLSA